MKALGAASGTALLGTTTVAAQSDTTENDTRTSDSGQAVGADDPYVGTWITSVTSPIQSGFSASGFEDQTLRLVVRTSIGGSSTRIRLSNTFGIQTITFDHVKIGVRDNGAAIVPGTNSVVTFGGEQEAMIPPGAIVYSDPVPLSVDAEQHLAVSMYTSGATGPATWHPLSLQTSYLSGGDDAGDTSGDDFTKELMSWYFLEGVDVVPEDNDASAIVTIGNSIINGTNSTPNVNHRYPNYLARRINDHSDVHRSVLNAGIAGNRVLSGGGQFGINALARLSRDVIAQPGVSDVVLLEGINDIGAGDVSAEQIIVGLKQIGIRCHAHSINVYVGTLTPTEGTNIGPQFEYGSPEGEAKRKIVNEFIRTGGFFDGVIDFDTAIQDPDQPDRILPKYDSGGHLHPSDAGYREMAKIVDLSLFESTETEPSTRGKEESRQWTA